MKKLICKECLDHHRGIVAASKNWRCGVDPAKYAKRADPRNL